MGRLRGLETLRNCLPLCVSRARFRHCQRLQAQGERRAHSLPRKRGACSPTRSARYQAFEDAGQVVATRRGC
jgi:hypothetical protein